MMQGSTKREKLTLEEKDSYNIGTCGTCSANSTTNTSKAKYQSLNMYMRSLMKFQRKLLES